MADEVQDGFPQLGAGDLDPEEDYRWSGYLVQRKAKKPAKRVMIGSYEEWFRWYMRFQRFRAFHTLVLIEPFAAVADAQLGGYIDGVLARLMDKVVQVVVVTKGGFAPPVADKRRVDAVLRAMLYGTRLSKSEILNETALTFVSLPAVMVEEELARMGWRISRAHPRYRLDDLDEELVQGMVPKPPAGYIFGKPDQIEQQFERERRFRRQLALPDELLKERILQDVAERKWVTVPYEWGRISSWLDGLNRAGDPRLETIFRSQEHVSDGQWMALLSPPKWQIRRVLEVLASEGRLERRFWFREVGRPAVAYHIPGQPPFLESRCGQCAFYASPKRRCRLWWLANKRRQLFDPAWERPRSTLTGFELHKMRWASRMGPHSSACQRFIDKKRDHNRKEIPEACEICSRKLQPPASGRSLTCGTCRTKYQRFGNGVRVLTAYEHEYDRLYHEITGGNAKDDLGVWKKDLKTRLPFVLQQKTEVGDLDVLAEDEETVEPPRVYPIFDQRLQENIDELRGNSDIPRLLSQAMGKSALNATKRVIEFAKLHPSEFGQALELQERYLAQIDTATPRRLLILEALIMNQYWRCYSAALKYAQVWLGPRKRSRFVREFVEDPRMKAKGYSPADAAINYLHQRRLRQAERINAEVGFSGRSDGFLHGERYNSRRVGLLLDMIDPFKFADREQLLLVILSGGMSWTDFRLETDRSGSTFYYPNARGTAILDRVSVDADNIIVSYLDRSMRISEAVREFASNMLQALTAGFKEPNKFSPFVYAE
jgi:CRISPR/Cas system-associated endonuclease Cas1